MAEENLFLLHTFVLGAFVTFVYDLLRILRRVVVHRDFWVSLEDLGFWLFCAAEVFLLMYRESNGKLRWFAVLGALMGMFLYRKICSGLLVKYVSLALGWILAVLGGLLGFVLRPFFFLGRKLAGVRIRAAAGRKRLWISLKKRLTRSLKMLTIVIMKR